MSFPSPEERVSVVMPVHNALPHLDAAVKSILDQSHADFEFVIYDDASTDGSTERLREWSKQDERIRLSEGKQNLGPVGSSDFVVEHSTSALVARMDADDTCSADRLERQLELFREKPRAGLVGSLFEIIDERGRRIRGPDYWRLARHSAFVPFAAHGSIMFRRSVYDRVGGYREECEFWEDQDLVARMAAVSEAWVIPLPLYQVRQWTRKTAANSDFERVENAVDLMYRCVARLEAKRSYDDLLVESRSHTPARVDPRVFISAGSKQLWADKRPLLFGRLLRRGKIRPDIQTLTALVWTSWASISPSTLRMFLRALLRTKNVRARKIAGHPAPIRWSPVSPTESADRNDTAPHPVRAGE
jgi:glycosyltransferase involved in cell wall biosynthesis